MNKSKFLENQDVANFIQWFVREANNFEINLNIKKSHQVPIPISKKFYGFNNVIGSYVWRAQWSIPGVQCFESCDWNSTAVGLKELGSRLRMVINNHSENEIMQVCAAILQWGGERNSNTGARHFLNEKLKNESLACYLISAKKLFRLQCADLENLSAIESVNSMLSKIYALASEDNLPIYDSRVAAAIASLVEVYRIERKMSWAKVPELLIFPTMYSHNNRRRHITGLHANALVSDGSILYYGQADTSHRWASAKVRLGWIIQEILDQSKDLFKNQAHSRAHAFEASLFMIGYDVCCLSGNLKNN